MLLTTVTIEPQFNAHGARVFVLIERTYAPKAGTKAIAVCEVFSAYSRRMATEAYYKRLTSENN